MLTAARQASHLLDIHATFVTSTMIPQANLPIIVHSVMFVDPVKGWELTTITVCDVMHAYQSKTNIIVSHSDYKATVPYVMKPCSKVPNLSVDYDVVMLCISGAFRCTCAARRIPVHYVRKVPRI